MERQGSRIWRASLPLCPKRLRAKLNLRWRVGTFLGNAQSTNECYVASSNGDVVKARAVIRVTSGSRWSKPAIEQIRGTPMCLRPQQASDSDAFIEESGGPHEHADETGDADDIAIGPAVTDQLDRTLRITLKDLREYGFTPNCPRCTDLQDGRYKSTRKHNNECRLRIYLAYQEHDHPKWQAVKHLFKSDEDFHESQIDGEGAPSTPKPDQDPAPPPFGDATPPVTPHGDNLESNDIGLGEEQSPMDQSDTMLNSDEMEIADLFLDSPDASMMDPVSENAMMDALVAAGVDEPDAEKASKS